MAITGETIVTMGQKKNCFKPDADARADRIRDANPEKPEKCDMDDKTRVPLSLNGRDEKMWRKVHDPVGARRLNLTRMVTARGLDPTDKYWAAYIQSACAEEARSPAAQRKGLGARLDSLTNLAALKEECRAHGLPASGTKAKLSQRLRDYASGVEPSKGKRRRGA